MTYVLALDVSMGKSYHVLYEDERCLSEGEITHTKFGFDYLLQEIQQLPELPSIVFESTGIYSRVIETFCQNNHLLYCLLNPLEAKKQLDSGLRVLKTDKQDAHRLAQTHCQYERKIKKLQPDIYEESHDLARFYQEIEAEIKRLRMYLHTALQLSFPELERLFSNRLSKLSLNLIELFPHPECLAGFSQTQIKNILKKSTDKRLSDKKALEKAQQLLSLASTSYPATTKTSIQVQKVRYYARQLKELLHSKETVSKQLIEQTRPLPEFDLYRSVPGIGEVSAALIIGEIGDIRRFENHKKVNAFVGIDTRRYQSGKYLAQDHINKRGNPKARKLLYFTVKNMIRQQAAAPNHIVDYYYKLKTQPLPKKDKVATVACMNKLLKCLYSMIKNETKYDYAYTVSMDQ
ncbi:IS110 family transposase [Enterococcus sp. AZ192]|uniref:IS110 family transposase n=1 Tax=unclassified Enterococcus TaxID=2608891 RepID=UPI003D280A33